VKGIFVPPDAIQHRFTSYPRWLFREITGAETQVWARRSIAANLFPPSEYVGQVRCLGTVSEDGRDHDAYEYDVYRDSESARTFYSHRSMMVEKENGLPFRTVSVSKTHASQWVETRRYDTSLTIPTPPPASAQGRVEMLIKRRAASPPESRQGLPLILGPADPYAPPLDPAWLLPPFVTMPPAEAPWPPPVHNWPPPNP